MVLPLPDENIRILLADDHPMIRQGLAALLSGAEGLLVAGEAGNGKEVLEKILPLAIQVVLLDLDMPVMNGLETTAALSRRHPEVRVLILTMHAEPALAQRCMQAGAAGYLLKTADQDDLLYAIRRVASGKRYFDLDMPQSMPSDNPDFARLATLTAREKEILTLIASGKTNAEIAEELFLSVKTVDTHRTNLMRKLDIHQVALLTSFAIKAGLI
ncbi:MAG: response regulator transcription factor [Bacteroidia bacterium]|nr:response regulator transcription factor [Bacteroidia bacterium]